MSAIYQYLRSLNAILKNQNNNEMGLDVLTTALCVYAEVNIYMDTVFVVERQYYRIKL